MKLLQIITLCTLFLALELAGAQVPSRQFSYQIDPDLTSLGGEIHGLRGGTPRRIAVMRAPDGSLDRFVEDEVILRATSPEVLNKFVATYRAKVLAGGDLPAPPPELQRRARRQFLFGDEYLLRVDLSTADTAELPRWLKTLDMEGQYRFSSKEAVQLFAIVVQARAEQGLDTAPNIITKSDGANCVLSGTRENPVGSGFLDAFAIRSLNDAQLRVTRAWQYVDLLELSFHPYIAFIDAGFAANDDIPADTPGYDFVDDDYDPFDLVAGGAQNCSGWHGLQSSSTAVAMLDNTYGAAGTGGPLPRPILFRVAECSSGSFFTEARAIRTAVAWGADVVSISRGGECGWWCRNFGLFSGMDSLTHAVSTASDAKVVVFASAGNDEKNLDDITQLPCEIDGVICVGAIDLTSKLAKRSQSAGDWGSNYGSKVDIWAPGTNVVTTPLPGQSDLSIFCCTSAAAPYAAGIASMLKSVDPTFTPGEIQSILQSTAQPSSDLRVQPGFVNAEAAVRAAAAQVALKPKGDNFEPNGSKATAAAVNLSTYTATIAPGDTDFFRLVQPDDYIEAFQASVRFPTAGGGNQLFVDALGAYSEFLPGELATAGPKSATVSSHGILSPDNPTWIQVAGQKSNTINCYTLTIDAQIAKIAPDVFDDGLFPNSQLGEPRNDDFAHATDLQLVQSSNPADWILTIVPGTEQIGGQMAKVVETNLNFETSFDVDWFRIKLDPNFKFSPEIGSECPSNLPTPPSGWDIDRVVKRARLEIRLDPVYVPQPEGFILGRRVPLQVTLYNSSGQIVAGPQILSHDWYVAVDCPNAVFPDGSVVISVNPGGKRTFYRIEATYREPYLIYRNRDALPHPENLLRLVDWDEIEWIGPPNPGPYHLVFPRDARLVDACIAGKCQEMLSGDYFVLAWPEAMTLDLWVSQAYPDTPIRLTLMNLNGTQLARSQLAPSEAARVSAPLAQRLTLHYLKSGLYLLHASGTGLQTYTLEFRLGQQRE